MDPENDPKLGIYAQDVEKIKTRFEVEIPQSRKKGLERFPCIKDRISAWTMADLTILAGAGSNTFDTLERIADAADALTENGSAYTDNALCAQRALDALMPDVCKKEAETKTKNGTPTYAWEMYYTYISNAAQIAKQQRSDATLASTCLIGIGEVHDGTKENNSLKNVGVNTNTDQWQVKDIKELYFTDQRDGCDAIMRLAHATQEMEEITLNGKKSLCRTARAQGAYDWFHAFRPLREYNTLKDDLTADQFIAMVLEAETELKNDPRWKQVQEINKQQEQRKMPPPLPLPKDSNEQKQPKGPMLDEGMIELPAELKQGFGCIAPQQEYSTQQAMQVLAERTELGTSHTVGKPLDTLVTEAVKGMKSSVRAA